MITAGQLDGELTLGRDRYEYYKGHCDRFRLTIADFGLSRYRKFPVQSMTKEIMTTWYRAPEVILGDFHYGN